MNFFDCCSHLKLDEMCLFKQAFKTCLLPQEINTRRYLMELNHLIYLCCCTHLKLITKSVLLRQRPMTAAFSISRIKYVCCIC